MFGNILHFVLTILFTLLGAALLVRAWMYAIRLHPFNPYSQAIFKVTDWLVQPVRRVFTPGKYLDWPSLVAAYVTALVFLLVSYVLYTGQLPVPEGWLRALAAALLTVLKWSFNLVLWVTLIQAVLSWVNPMAPAMPVLQTLTAPLLDPIRRILPNLGGLDLSPLVLLILAQVAMMVLENVAFNLFGV
jgi:YggT family protein